MAGSTVEPVTMAARAIDSADALIVAAGAGMGVDSGLPDYRGKDGFWNRYPLYAKRGLEYMKVSRARGFLVDPEFAWGFYGHQLELYRATRPHDGYGILLEVGQTRPGGYFVVTTNVDGQFQLAGFDPQRIHECHGSIHRLQCIHPCSRDVWSAEGTIVEVDEKTMRARPPLPACRNCGAMVRPSIYMFGDFGYIWEVAQEQAERFRQWRSENAGRRIAIVECGAGTTVPGLRRFCEQLAAESPATKLIRINPHEPECVVPGSISIAATALDALKMIAQVLGSAQNGRN